MHRLAKLILTCLSVVSLVSTVGCASSSQVATPHLNPIDVSETGTAPITFNRLVIRVTAGTELGHHHDGILKIRKQAHVWGQNVAIASDEFKLTASETMRAYGYKVLGGDNLLFGPDESGKAAYQLGGTVNRMMYDTYAPLAGDYAEATLDIEWQLYDALAETVIYTKRTQGHTKLDAPYGNISQLAFSQALDNLLADQMFVDAVQAKPTEQRFAEARISDTDRCQNRDVVSLPEDLEAAIDATILIRMGSGTGSGVVVSPNGYALTAAHVVSSLDEVVVRFPNGLELTAAVVSVDNGQDIALIKLPGSGHSCLQIGPTEYLPVGTDLFAIGAPAGQDFAFSVSRGVVSGYREDELGRKYLQTDTSLNPGNSGGPLLDRAGRIVGIVSWKIAALGYEGLAFGVPATAITTSLGIGPE